MTRSDDLFSLPSRRKLEDFIYVVQYCQLNEKTLKNNRSVENIEMLARQRFLSRILSRVNECSSVSVVSSQCKHQWKVSGESKIDPSFVSLAPSLCNHHSQLGYPFCGSQKRSNLFLSKCFSLAGIIGVMGTKSEEKETKPGEEKIVEMIKMSKLCHSRAEFKKSEQLLHLALRMAYEIQHYDAQRYIIDDMANNAYETGDLRKAEKLFIDTMKHLIATGVPQDDNSVIHISGKLANLYAMFDDVDKAYEGFLFCIQNLETKLEKGVNDFDTQALYTLILSWFGQFLHNKGDFVQSLNMFEKSLEVSVKINGEHHPHSLLQLNNMAATFTLMNRLQDALRCLNKALTLAQEHQMDDAIGDLPYYYINVANIYLTQVEKSSADSSELLRLAASSCGNALKWARLVDDKEALKQAKKCWKKIENYQVAQ